MSEYCDEPPRFFPGPNIARFQPTTVASARHSSVGIRAIRLKTGYDLPATQDVLDDREVNTMMIHATW
jgi:hypothetical protein